MFCFGTEIGNCQFDGHIEFIHDADCVMEVDRTREGTFDKCEDTAFIENCSQSQQWMKNSRVIVDPRQ